jgi:hypothetical protein
VSYQNFNRLPIIDQTAPLVSYTVEQDVYGTEEEIAGWFVVEHSVINGVYVTPGWYFSKEAAFEAMLQIEA